jgi:hypothetical protein
VAIDPDVNVNVSPAFVAERVPQIAWTPAFVAERVPQIAWPSAFAAERAPQIAWLPYIWPPEAWE